MEIVEYSDKYKDDFIRLNKNWIEENFGALEEEDYHTFSNVSESIENGAMIYCAVENDAVLAVCMTVCEGDGTWEISKFATDPKQRGKGAGSLVFKACMDYAKNKDAKKIIIISNTKLPAALHIYKKFGFTEFEIKNCPYKRGDIFFEYNF